LAQAGHECRAFPCRPDKYRSLPLLGFRLSGLVKRWFRWSDLKALDHWNPDVVVLERELFSDDSFDVEQSLRRRVRKLVLDIDDGLFVLHRHKFEVLCGLSDLVIVGNNLLADRVRPINPRAVVIPTCVDLDKFLVTTSKGRFDSARNSQLATRNFVLGWTGTAANIEYLEVLREPLRQLAREFPIELHVIAESNRPLQRLRFDEEGIPTRFIRWSVETEVADLSTFDVGLMPMPDNEWTRYKCGLKILQYMAAAIPAIASPVGVNAEIIQHGVTGWLASTPAEWLNVLRHVLTTRADQADVITRARDLVEKQYSVQAQFPRLIACLSSVVNSPC
jgi:glycosyltransferase involved in cell wall biosynthesis